MGDCCAGFGDQLVYAHLFGGDVHGDGCDVWNFAVLVGWHTIIGGCDGKS